VKSMPSNLHIFSSQTYIFFPGGGGGGFPKLELVEGSGCIDGGRRRGH